MLFSPLLLARLFLTGAILTEVAGTSTMALIPENEAGWLHTCCWPRPPKQSPLVLRSRCGRGWESP